MPEVSSIICLMAGCQFAEFVCTEITQLLNSINYQCSILNCFTKC